MKAYVIIGDGGTRKSGVVRCLTGVFGGGKRDVKFVKPNQVFPVYVQVRSLQEIGNKNIGKFIKDINQSGVKHLLVCLRDTAFRGCLDSGGYLKAFKAAGWNIHREVRMNQSNRSNARVLYVPNSRNMPSNEVASLVRSHFGWV